MNKLEVLLNDPRAVKWLGVTLLVVGSFFAVGLMISDPEGQPRRQHARYVAFLERRLRQMFVWTSGEHIALGQMFAFFAVIAAHLLWELPYWYVFAALTIFGPAGYIEILRRQRIAKIEEQLDGFILAVANALKSTPSIGDAFISVQKLLARPIRDEVELAVKEMRLGSTLDQALLLMASRIGSRQVDSALAAVLIGRQVGGNLPKILETTAAALREMQRLEGVVRTKTAEGKVQLWVLAIFPVGIIYAMNSISPGYFDPLTENLVGYICTTAAVVLWLASILMARKILNVDI
jgi:tight adherence protein B